MTGSPTDYVAEWKSGSALRQNEKKIKKINRLQSKNRARPMVARLKRSGNTKETLAQPHKNSTLCSQTYFIAITIDVAYLH